MAQEIGRRLRRELRGARAGGDLDHFAGDVGLANLVVGQRQVLDQFLCVVGRVAHRDHLGRLLAGGQLQHRLVEPRGHVARQQLPEHRVRARLEDELAAGDPSVSSLGSMGRSRSSVGR